MGKKDLRFYKKKISYTCEKLSENSMIKENNNIIREVISTYCSERVLFLNAYPLLQDYHQIYYSDHMHQPGVLSNNLVLDAIFSTLTTIT